MRQPSRRRLLGAATALASGAAWSPSASAQSGLSNRPIRLIIPTATGSASDVVARAYAERMSLILKQPMIAESMPGAGTRLATRHVLNAPADGHTLLVSANTLVTLPYVDKAAGFSPSDFAGIANLATSPLALVVGSQSPHRVLADLIATARKSPGSITFASVGVGTTSHLPVELLAQSAGIRMDLIPYKGIPLAIPDVVAGRVAFMMGTAATVGELIKAGKLRALAITSDKRSLAFPGVPTFAELGHTEATYELFLGLVGLARIPLSVRARLAEAAEEAKADPDLRKRLATLGQELPAQVSADQFNAFLVREASKMSRVVRTANIESSQD